MKKISIIALAIFVLLLINTMNVTEEIIIPNEAIRIRVIANSNSFADQELKKHVKESVQNQLNALLKDATSIEEVRRILNNNLKDVEYTVKEIVNKQGNDNGFDVDFGYNYFPKKTYKGISYDEGYYESIVISLGKSKGNNWWCVLFPPLCLVDEAEDDMETVEYKSFVKELIDKYF